MNNFYNKYNYNIYSQNGEDGIIEELLKKLNIKNGYVCEFGAWDGIYCSNTFNLIKKGFNAVLIEEDEKKFQDLLKTQSKNKNIIAINKFVDHKSDSNNLLDNILKETDIPIDFDVLSIDIDSYDYQVWKSMKIYKPKIVIIEINSSIDPKNANWIHNPQENKDGTGFLPTYNLAIEKEYKFVVHTGNMIFILNELYDKLNIDSHENPLNNFRNNWIIN